MELITEKETQGFTPFMLNLKIETEEEARLFYHIFNRHRIRDKIFEDTYGEIYSRKIKEDFSEFAEIRRFILERVSL